MGWLYNILDAIGKATPNEIAKLNSITQYIPLVGDVSRAVSSADNLSTSYVDLRDKGYSSPEALVYGAQAGAEGYFGSRDSGMYGSPNVNRDWANTIGQIGNYFSFRDGNVSVNPSALNAHKNQYFNKGGDMAIDTGSYLSSNEVNKPYITFKQDERYPKYLPQSSGQLPTSSVAVAPSDANGQITKLLSMLLNQSNMGMGGQAKDEQSNTFQQTMPLMNALPFPQVDFSSYLRR